jgi:CheY-like chemotaxis protein
MRTTPHAPAGPRVLVIEDNPDARDSLCLALMAHGCDVRAAADGPEGVRLALEWRPEVVISDIGLPAMNGWEVGRQVRAALGAGVFLVALTGYAQPSDRDRSKAAGFNHHLVKPVEPELLLRLFPRGPNGGNPTPRA